MKKHRKIIIAPDSFKGSISARGAADAIEAGLAAGATDRLNLEIVKLPIADGGEGTLDTLVNERDRITLTVTGTAGDPVKASYGYLGNTAVIEMATAAGLTLVKEADRDASSATTYGVGELILDALKRGFHRIMLTVGGSGTNDGGCGMFAALGARFLNRKGTAFVPTGKTLSEIDKIDLSQLSPLLKTAEFLIATDVKNPLCGENGATRVYARQKGATDEMLDLMESGMLHYAHVLRKTCGRDVAKIEGCGAGGGLAAPLLSICNAEIRSGIEAVLEANDFNRTIQGASLVITGEGKIDAQSLCGKAISGVANAAKAQNIPVVCFVGCIGDDIEKLKALGVSDIRAIADLAPSAEYSMQHADILLKRLAEEYIHL